MSLNDILTEEQRIVGEDGWKVSHVETEEEIPRAIEAAKTATEVMPRLMAVGRIGLAVNLLDRSGSNFKERGILENELLGVPQESLREVIARMRAEGV